jgi:hypothetical protein
MSAQGKPTHSYSRRRTRYGAYLLRFWAEPRGEPGLPPIWRFSLEDPHSGRRWAFAGLDRLVAFLRREMEVDPAGEESPAPSREDSSDRPLGQKEA